MEENYWVFHRTMWIPNPAWPQGREPGFGKKHHIGFAETIDEARAMCAEWDEAHDEGPYGDKAEFTRDF